MTATAQAIRQPQIFKGYIPELNALRAVGICVVVMVHFWPTQTVWASFRFAWMLMDSFFVLSGFLITGILLDNRERPNYYKTFYSRRALRILPVYYCVLVLVTLWLGVAKPPEYLEMTHNWGLPWWFFVYLGNIPTGIKSVWPCQSYMPLWSLQIEEQFYLLFPILVHRLKLDTLVRVLWGMIVMSFIGRIAMYWWDPANTWAPYVLLPLRMDGLALGALVAIRFRRGPWNISKRRLTWATIGWLGFTCICVYIGGIDSSRPFVRTFGFFMSSVAWAHVVVWLILFRGANITRALRIRLVQYVSNISYALYLIHAPIGSMVEAVGRTKVPQLSHGLPRLLATFSLSFVCAAVSWRFLERPLLNLKNRIGPKL